MGGSPMRIKASRELAVIRIPTGSQEGTNKRRTKGRW